MKNHPLFVNEFSDCGFSIIEQPPLDGNKINFLLWIIKGSNYNKFRIGNVFYMETENLTHIFHCIRQPFDTSNTLKSKTIEIFEQHKNY